MDNSGGSDHHPDTVPAAIAHHAATAGEHPAVIVADGPIISYTQLHEQVDAFATALAALGVGHGRHGRPRPPRRRGDGHCVPGHERRRRCRALNPSYREGEFDFEIDDLSLAAMIVGTGTAEVTAAVDAAVKRDVPVIRVSSTTDAGVEMRVTGDPVRDPIVDHRSAAEDVALVLHTSGTTARPKIVPLRHENLMASARAIGTTLQLDPADRCCNVMPLFHIHGLIAGLCSSLVAGSTVICTTGFSAADMPRWLGRHEASWYTAVPTMHQALLDRARSRPDEFADVGLRLVRSSSSSLPPSVMAELEAAFSCPVVEAYGMTEAAHQMACNPLPPAVRKPGSVGPAAGPDVAIMSEHDGRLLPVGDIGEVVIKGPNVMAGYLDNAAANDAAFTDGWFRTGDQGRLDDDGYLFLTGRLKEIINRGGENVSPREIDEVLLEHGAVAQAVTFSVPDSRLGEQVAAAVVLAGDDQPTSERELREYVASRVAPYKVPRVVVFVDSIPKGPSGKLQRLGLADQLGLAELDARDASTEHVAPATPAELLMAELWSEALGRDEISATAHFLDVGGDSLAATRLLTRVRDEIDLEVSMLDFFDAPTITEQGALIEKLLLAEEPSA